MWRISISNYGMRVKNWNQMQMQLPWGLSYRCEECGSEHLILRGGAAGNYFGPGYFFFTPRIGTCMDLYFLRRMVLDFFQPGSCV